MMMLWVERILLASGILFWLLMIYFTFMIAVLTLQDNRAKRREQVGLDRVEFPGVE